MSDRVDGLTWPEASARPAAVLVVALGATEQHGPHLPLGVDTTIAGALASAVVAARPGLVLGPGLPYGASGEHQDFPGTLSIGTEALELLLVELGRSAARSFAGLLVLNAHGGNAAALRAAVDRLRGEGRDVRGVAPRWRGDAHAGLVETSVMLALEPAAVRHDRVAPGAREPLDELLPELRRDGVRAVSPGGVLGDPRGASAARGRALLRAATDDVLARIDGWWPALRDAPTAGGAPAERARRAVARGAGA